MESEIENEKENEKVNDMTPEECYYYCKAFLERINEGNLADSYKDKVVFGKDFVPDKGVITSVEHYGMFHNCLMKVEQENFSTLTPYINEEMFAHYFCMIGFNTLDLTIALQDLCCLLIHMGKNSENHVGTNKEFQKTLKRLKNEGAGCVLEVMKAKSSNEQIDDEWIKEMTMKYVESMKFN